MARDSKRVRHLRRIKRDRTNLLRMLDHALQERNMWREAAVKEMSSKLRPDTVTIEPSTMVNDPTTPTGTLTGETIGYVHAGATIDPTLPTDGIIEGDLIEPDNPSN